MVCEENAGTVLDDRKKKKTGRAFRSKVADAEQAICSEEEDGAVKIVEKRMLKRRHERRGEGRT